MVLEGSGKKPIVVDLQLRGRQGKSHYGKCGKSHDRVCRLGGYSRYKCSKTNHFIGDYPTIHVSDLICFHFNQRFHKKANFPSLDGGTVATPYPATLRIIDDRQSTVEALVVRIRAF